MKSKRQVNKKLLLVLLVIVISLMSLFALNFNKISLSIRETMHKIYLASVDVSSMDISAVLIDEDKNQYTSYEWNSTLYSEIRNITYQINYKKNSLSASYNPGDLEIQVDNLYYYYIDINSATRGSLKNYVIISADEYNNNATSHNFEWSYKYSDDYSKIIITNNNEIPANLNFEGSIQITYKLVAYSLKSDVTSTLTANLNGTKDANAVTFYYSGTDSTLKIANAFYNKLISYDGLPEGDYTWIRVSFYTAYESLGSRLFEHGQFLIDGPENMLIQNEQYGTLYSKGEKIKINNTTSCGIDSVDAIQGASFYPENCMATSAYYLGIPNDIDPDLNLSFKFYSDYYYSGKSKDYDNQYEILDYDLNLNLNDYKLVDDGITFSINNNYNSPYSYEFLEKDYSVINTYPLYLYNTGRKHIDIKIGEDSLYLNKTDNTMRKFSDDDYYYEYILFPGKMGNNTVNVEFKNGNDKEIDSGQYTVDLYVRYKNENSYVLYDTFLNQGKIYRDFPKEVVGYYFYIHDYNMSLHPLTLRDAVHFYDKSIAIGDTLYRYPFVQVFDEGINITNTTYLKDTDYAYSYFNDYDNTYLGGSTSRRPCGKRVDNLDHQTYTNLNFQDFTIVSNDTYKSRVFVSNLFSTADVNYSGYKTYILLSEGLYVNSVYDIEKKFYGSLLDDYRSVEGIDYKAKLNSGDIFYSTDKERFINYLKNHTSVNIINNWNNTNRQMIEISLDLTDDNLDAYNYYLTYSLINYINNQQLGSFEFDVYINKDSIMEYGKTTSVETYTKSMDHVLYDPKSSDKSYVTDANDIDNNSITSEYLWYQKVTKSIALASESSQNMKTTAKSNKDNYGEDINVSKNTQYTYKLRARNANNKVTNLVIYDSIEKYIKRDGNYELAAGDNDYFQGEFIGIDTSYAQSQGYNVKVYYSENDQPGDLSSSDWKAYTSTVTKSKVKSLAFEYLDSSNNKAIIPEDTLTYVEVIMKSDVTAESGKMKTYNGSWVEWNALDSTNNILPSVVGINSNIASVTLPCRVTVHHHFPNSSMDYDEVFDDLIYGSEFTAHPKADLPANIVYDKPLFDRTETFNVTEPYDSIYLNYKYIDINRNLTNSVSGTTMIRNSDDPVTYILKQDYVISNYLGEAHQKMTLTLSYNIDVSKSNLNGGVYDSSTRTITWNDYIPVSSMDEVTGSTTHQASLVYTNLPTTGNFTANANFVTSFDYGGWSTQDLTYTTSYEPKYKITVKHINYYNDTEVFKEEVFYKYKNETYETSPTTSIPDNFKLKTSPTNATGTVGTNDINVYYYYDHKEYTYNHEATITGPSVIYDRSQAVIYNIVFHGDVTNYIGDLNIEIPITLPYKIDLTKSALNGFTYDEANNKLILTDVIHVTSMEKHSYNYDRMIVLYYLNIPSTDKSIFVRKISHISYYPGTNGFDITNDSNVTTNISKKSKLTVKHVDYDTGELLLPIKETIYPSGSYYSVSISTSVPKNYDYVYSGEAKTGYIYDEDIEVVLKYKKRTVNTELYINQFTGPERTDKRSNVLDYHLEAYSKIENYLGDYSNTATITLKYKIDPSKSDLDGGTYNASNKTITWVHNYSSDDTTEQRKDISHDISLAFIDIPWDGFNIIVSPKLLLTYGDKTSNYNGSSAQTVIDETYPIYIKYVDYQTNEEIAPSETIYAKYYETYTAHESSQIPDNYELKSQPYNYTGHMLNNPTNVIYYYQKKKTNLETSIETTTTESITSREDAVDIGIKYHFKTSDYIGSATITIVDQLPYEIDVNSSELDGGIYDPILKTITWIINLDIDSIDEYSEDINKNITVVFKDIDITNDITNIVKGTIQLEDDDDQKETVAVTNINIDGKIIIRYVDENNNEIQEPTIIIRPVNEIYEPDYINIDGYELPTLPMKLIVTEEEQTITYRYNKIVEVVKGEEEVENPKTGLFNYLLLIIPSTILLFGYKFVDKYKLFKKM